MHSAEKTHDASTKSGVPRGNGEHVLVVDDDVSLARIFGRLLQSIGYRVTVQTHPTQALELFEKDPAPYQIALVDLHMPPPGGAYLAKRLHELKPELPVFLMSGYSDDLGTTSPEALGIVGILQKPVTRETLASALRNALDRSAAE